MNEIRRIGLCWFMKVPVGNIGLYPNGHFSAKNISFKIGKKEFVYFSKSPGLEGPKTSERTLFSQKYFV
jgi:hypothetical protein